MICCSTTSYERTQFEKRFVLWNYKVKARDSTTLWERTQLWKKTLIVNCNMKVRHHAKKYEKTQFWKKTRITNRDTKKFMFYSIIEKHDQQIKLKMKTFIKENFLSINHYNKTAISSIIFAWQYTRQIAISRTTTLQKHYANFAKQQFITTFSLNYFESLRFVEMF